MKLTFALVKSVVLPPKFLFLSLCVPKCFSADRYKQYFKLFGSVIKRQFRRCLTKPRCKPLVEVTLEKVNHGKLKFTMVNGTASVTPNFQFTMVNQTLVSCPDNSGKNKVDLTLDKNLVTKKIGGYISCLSKPCLFC